MTPQSRQRLEAFITVAERIEQASYTKKVEGQGGTSVSIKWNNREDQGPVGGSIAHNFPNEEAIIAIAVRARQFIQAGDTISLRQMAVLLEDPGISPEWKERFQDVRNHMTTYLNTPSMMQLNDKRHTNREIFDIFVNGSIAHHDQKYADWLNQWKAMDMAYVVLQQSFHQTVNNIVAGIAYLYNYTKLELAGEPVPPISPSKVI